MHEKQIKLTKREKEVFELLQQGYTKKEIAQQLYLSICTVRTYVNSLLAKYELHTVSQLLAQQIQVVPDKTAQLQEENNTLKKIVKIAVKSLEKIRNYRYFNTTEKAMQFMTLSYLDAEQALIDIQKTKGAKEDE